MAQGTLDVTTGLQKRTNPSEIDRLLMVNPDTQEPQYIEMEQVTGQVRGDMLPAFDLNNVRVMTTKAPDNSDIKSNVLDPFTGEAVTFREYSGPTPILDGFVFIEHADKVFRRVIRSINYAMFGAVGDGVNDDAVQIKLAHQVANLLNLPVINEEGEYWLKNPNNIPVKTNVSLGKTIFHIDESKHSDTNRWFLVEPSAPSVDIVLSSAQKTSFLGKLKRGVDQITELSSYEGHLIIVFDANDLVYRNGSSGGGYPKLEMFTVAKDGKIDGNILFELSDYTSLKAYPIEKDWLTISGGSFNLNNQNNPAMAGKYICSGFFVKRSKVKIVNQDVSVDGTPILMQYYDLGFYFPENTFEFQVDDIKLTPRKVGGSGTYSIGGRQVFKFKISNVSSTAGDTYWGSMGTHNVKDLVVNNSFINRVDCHFNGNNISISNTTTNSIALNGGGMLSIHNTEVRNPTYLYFRADFGASWDGDITITQPKHVINTSSAARMIDFLVPDTDFDYNLTLVNGRRIFITDVNILYNAVNNEYYDFFRFSLVAKNIVTGARTVFPSLVRIENVKVEGRDKGVRLLNVNDTNGWYLEKEGSYNNGALKTNSLISFVNVDTDSDDPSYQTIFLGSAFTPTDSNNWFPKIVIDRCYGLNLQLRDSIVDVFASNSELSMLRTMLSGWRGSITFLECDIKPRSNFVVGSGNNGIGLIKSKIGLPLVGGSPPTKMTQFNNAFGDLMTVNNQLSGSHLNTLFTADVLSLFSSLSIDVRPEYYDMLRVKNATDDNVMRRRYGTTGERPTGIQIGFPYFDTSLGRELQWSGSSWVSTYVNVANYVRSLGATLTPSDGSKLSGSRFDGAISFNVTSGGSGYPVTNGDVRTFNGPSNDRTYSILFDKDSTKMFIQRYDSNGDGLGWELVGPKKAASLGGSATMEQLTNALKAAGLMANS